MASKLQSFLNEKYGPGNYVTGLNLDWSDRVEIRPGGFPESFSRSTSGLTIDRPVEREKISYGEGYVSLGIHESAITLPSQSPYSGVFIFAACIKKPGTDRHHLPKQIVHLAPVISDIASHHFDLSPYASTKFCGVLVRTLPLKPDVGLITEDDWHVHKIFNDCYINRQRAAFLEIPEETISLLPQLARNSVQSEYLIADTSASCIQTRASEQPMELEERDGSYNLRRAPQHHRQADPMEIVNGNAYSYHKAPQPAVEIRDGRMRTIIAVSYTPTILTYV